MADSVDSENTEDGLFLSEELVQSPSHTPAQTGTIDFGGLLHPHLRLHQDLSGLSNRWVKCDTGADPSLSFMQVAMADKFGPLEWRSRGTFYEVPSGMH